MSKDKKVSRRSAIVTGLSILGTAAATASAYANDAKINQAVVNYRDRSDPDGHHCITCVNFLALASCRLVSGRIDPNGSCIAYAPVSASGP